jgi:hypothetical protein
MDVQTISVVIAAVSVVIGVINSILSSRRAAQNDQLMLETRQAQLFTQINSWWRTRDAVKAYGNVRYVYSQEYLKTKDFDDFLSKYHINVDPEAYADQMTLWAFLEGIGVLVKRRLIDIDMVKDLLSERIVWFWENLFAPNIDQIRKLTDDPTQYDHIEYLYHEMKRR